METLTATQYHQAAEAVRYFARDVADGMAVAAFLADDGALDALADALSARGEAIEALTPR